MHGMHALQPWHATSLACQASMQDASLHACKYTSITCMLLAISCKCACVMQVVAASMHGSSNVQDHASQHAIMQLQAARVPSSKHAPLNPKPQIPIYTPNRKIVNPANMQAFHAWFKQHACMEHVRNRNLGKAPIFPSPLLPRAVPRYSLSLLLELPCSLIGSGGS